MEPLGSLIFSGKPLKVTMYVLEPSGLTDSTTAVDSWATKSSTDFPVAADVKT
jgi:hypothetical protein